MTEQLAWVGFYSTLGLLGAAFVLVAFLPYKVCRIVYPYYALAGPFAFAWLFLGGVMAPWELCLLVPPALILTWVHVKTVDICPHCKRLMSYAPWPPRRVDRCSRCGRSPAPV
jgi:hypothetical protein